MKCKGTLLSWQIKCRVKVTLSAQKHFALLTLGLPERYRTHVRQGSLMELVHPAATLPVLLAPARSPLRLVAQACAAMQHRLEHNIPGRSAIGPPIRMP